MLEETNYVRDSLNLDKITENKICAAAAEYQVKYTAYFGTFSHRNDYEFENVKLCRGQDRFDYFQSKLKDKKDKRDKYNYLVSQEVLSETIGIRNFNDGDNITYKEFAHEILYDFLESPQHKTAILSSYKKGTRIRTRIGSYKCIYNPNKDLFLVVGVFNYEFK